MIGVDWGTTAFRAYRVADGRVTATIARGPALLATPPGGHGAALRQAIAPWLQDGETRILMAGMVGSRQGWVEAPYLPLPADLAGLAAAATRIPFPGADLRLLPGLCTRDQVPEVMRGEEVQLAGLLPRLGTQARVCLPGTHSKWVAVDQGRITGFTTHLTGELFATLRQHTILARLMPDPAADTPPDPEAFRAGVDRSAQPGGLPHHLFGVRTLGLFGHLPPEAAPAYLSGLLIGHELRAEAPAGPVHLVGAAPLTALYAQALAHLGATPVLHPDTAAAGLAHVAGHIAWDPPCS